MSDPTLSDINRELGELATDMRNTNGHVLTHIEKQDALNEKLFDLNRITGQRIDQESTRITRIEERISLTMRWVKILGSTGIGAAVLSALGIKVAG